jgi:hypothetical protein
MRYTYRTEARKLLRKALGLINKGWVKHYFRDGDRYCALGAINSSLKTLPEEAKNRAKKELVAAIRVRTNDRHTSVMGYNDDAYTTKDDVVGAFKAAIRNLR